MTLLRYREDRRSVGLYAVHVSAMGACWALGPEGVLGWLAIAFLAISSFSQLVSAHNAQHGPVFQSKALGRVWKVALSLAVAYPSSVFVPVHNLSHHADLQSPRDVLRTTEFRHRLPIVNLLSHLVVGTVHTHLAMAYFFLVEGAARTRWRRQVLMEVGALAAVFASLIALRPDAFLWFVLLPAFLGQLLVVGFGGLQHSGLDPDDPWGHSRNFTGSLFNYLAFDNGFHTIHHQRPGLHWSRCREAHERLIAPHIDPELNQRSLAAYLWRTYRPRAGAPLPFRDMPPPRTLRMTGAEPVFSPEARRANAR